MHRGRDVEVVLMTHFRHHTTTGSPLTTQMNHRETDIHGGRKANERK